MMLLLIVLLMVLLYVGLFAAVRSQGAPITSLDDFQRRWKNVDRSDQDGQLATSPGHPGKLS